MQKNCRKYVVEIDKMTAQNVQDFWNCTEKISAAHTEEYKKVLDLFEEVRHSKGKQ